MTDLRPEQNVLALRVENDPKLQRVEARQRPTRDELQRGVPLKVGTSIHLSPADYQRRIEADRAMSSRLVQERVAFQVRMGQRDLGLFGMGVQAPQGSLAAALGAIGW